MTTNKEVQSLQVLDWRDLHHATFTFNKAFQLNLMDDECFVAEQVVRIIPKRRIVAFGTWRDRQVVAKLFFDPVRAKKHMQHDIEGMKLLRECKIPRPALYFKGISADRRVYIAIFERIFNANNFAEVWSQRDAVENIFPLLESVVKEIATQHVLGIVQQDLHLKNFLFTQKKIYTLDGAQIERFPYLLPKKVSINNLALFLSQLGVDVEQHQEQLFRRYAELRGWILTDADMLECKLAIKHWNEQRWQKFEKKIFRECSTYAEVKGKFNGIYDRAYAQPELMQFLADPEMAFAHSTMKMLKDGNSSTVVKVTLDQRDFVVKRYNLKDTKHKLRRSLRATRASHAWRLSHKLHFFGVATATPVAFLEKSWFGLKGKSYFVTEYVSDQHAGMRLQSNAQIDTEKLIQTITVLLKNVSKLEVTHGDLKITNILIDKEDKPVLIDLDGASEHTSISSLRNAWKKEIQRFLQNFDDYPAMYQAFAEALK